MLEESRYFLAGGLCTGARQQWARRFVLEDLNDFMLISRGKFCWFDSSLIHLGFNLILAELFHTQKFIAKINSIFV